MSVSRLSLASAGTLGGVLALQLTPVRAEGGHHRLELSPVIAVPQVQQLVDDDTAHYLTMKMVAQLGFYVLAMRRQYIRPSVQQPEPRSLLEVQRDLGCELEPHDGVVSAMVNHFTTSIPVVAERTTTRWHISGPLLASYFLDLLYEQDQKKRNSSVAALAVVAATAHGEIQDWHRV
jgi:hypothetical protein